MSSTNSLFTNPESNWLQNQPVNALAPFNVPSMGTYYGEPGYQYPTTAQPQAAAPVAAPQAVPGPASPTYTPPYPASQAYNDAYNTQMATNKAVYGTDNTQMLGTLGMAGFPLYTDPRLIQDRLAQTYQAGGPNAQAAYDELQRQFALASGGGSNYGGGTGGGISGGGSGGHGQDASGKW